MSLHFFDVGANIGQTFDDYLVHRPEFDGCDVWCFEPSPRHLPDLMLRARDMSERFKVHVCPFGLRGNAEILPFYMKDDPRGDSFQVNLASDHAVSNLRTGFQLHAVAECCGQFIVDHTAKDDEVILKLDIEGSEYELLTFLALDAEALARVKQIMVEFHYTDLGPGIMNPDQLKAKFESLGKPLTQWTF